MAQLPLSSSSQSSSSFKASCGCCQSTKILYCPRCLSHQYFISTRIASIKVLSESYVLANKINGFLIDATAPLKFSGHGESSDSSNSTSSEHNLTTNIKDTDVLSNSPESKELNKQEEASKLASPKSSSKPVAYNKNAFIMNQQKERLIRARQKQLAIRKSIESINVYTSQSVERIKQLKSKLETQSIQLRMKSLTITDSRKQQFTIPIEQDILDNLKSKLPTTEESLMKISQKLCKDLGLIFDIKERWRNHSASHRSRSNRHNGKPHTAQPSSTIETYINFMMVPNYLHLGKYGCEAINAATDRIAYFCQYLAYYLRTQLPYPISLPQPNDPFVRIGILVNGTSSKRPFSRDGLYYNSNNPTKQQRNGDSVASYFSSATMSSTQKSISSSSELDSEYSTVPTNFYSNAKVNRISIQKLFLRNDIFKMFESDLIREFEGYATGLAMLFINLTYIAQHLGIELDESILSRPTERPIHQRNSSRKESNITQISRRESNTHSMSVRNSPSPVMHLRQGSTTSVSTVEQANRPISGTSTLSESMTSTSTFTATASASGAPLSGFKNGHHRNDSASSSNNTLLLRQKESTELIESESFIDEEPANTRRSLSPMPSSTISPSLVNCVSTETGNDVLDYQNRDIARHTSPLHHPRSANNGESLVNPANNSGKAIGVLKRPRWSYLSRKGSEDSNAEKTQGKGQIKPVVINELEYNTNDHQNGLHDEKINRKKNNGKERKVMTSKDIELINILEDEKAIKLLRVDKILLSIQKVLLNGGKIKEGQEEGYVTVKKNCSSQSSRNNSNDSNLNVDSNTKKDQAGGIWGIGGAIWNYSPAPSGPETPNEALVKVSKTQKPSTSLLTPATSNSTTSSRNTQEKSSARGLMPLMQPPQSSSSSSSLPVSHPYSSSSSSSSVLFSEDNTRIQNEHFQWPYVISVRDLIVTRNLKEFNGDAAFSTEWNLVESGDFE